MQIIWSLVCHECTSCWKGLFKEPNKDKNNKIDVDANGLKNQRPDDGQMDDPQSQEAPIKTIE